MENILLHSNDMAKLGCSECKGCSDCCRGMGSSIILDPYDVMMLKAGLNKSFEELMQKEIELTMQDGLILPSLTMNGENESCAFLVEGRCSIHSFRPGLCRLFPLGRDYSMGTLKYFMLDDACSIKNRTKVKISKWLEVKNLQKYEMFLSKWHSLLKALRNEEYEDDERKNICMLILQYFYMNDFSVDDFYDEFEVSLDKGTLLL